MRATMDGNDRLLFGHEPIQVIDKANIVVAGGGIAGWAAAVAAGRAGAQVVLVEQDAFPGGAVTAGMMAQWGAGSARLSGMLLASRDETFLPYNRLILSNCR